MENIKLKFNLLSICAFLLFFVLTTLIVNQFFFRKFSNNETLETRIYKWIEKKQKGFMNTWQKSVPKFKEKEGLFIATTDHITHNYIRRSFLETYAKAIVPRVANAVNSFIYGIYNFINYLRGKPESCNVTNYKIKM